MFARYLGLANAIYLFAYLFVKAYSLTCEGHWESSSVPITDGYFGRIDLPKETNNFPKVACPFETYKQSCYFSKSSKEAKSLEQRYWKLNNSNCVEFESKTVLNLFRGRKIVFIGDSVLLQTMQTLVCRLYSKGI